MDSSGLGALVQYANLSRDANIYLLICSLNEQIQILFELTGMDRLFEVFPGREELESQIQATR